MRLGLVAGVILVALVGTQGAFGSVGPVGGSSLRDQNRQILIAEEGPNYDPNRATLVIAGPIQNRVTSTVPLWQAIEIHLDLLDSHGISLVTLLLQAASPGDPDWPLVGHIKFREKGWKQMGAQCPGVETSLPPAVEEQYDQLVAGGDNKVGVLTTQLSNYHLNEFGDSAPSNLYYWTADQSTSEEPTDNWEYVEWELEGAPLIDYFCQVPTTSGGQVKHNSIVSGYVTRTDEA